MPGMCVYKSRCTCLYACLYMSICMSEHVARTPPPKTMAFSIRCHTCMRACLGLESGGMSAKAKPPPTFTSVGSNVRSNVLAPDQDAACQRRPSPRLSFWCRSCGCTPIAAQLPCWPYIGSADAVDRRAILCQNRLNESSTSA